jgi:hypothetical protein
MHSILKTREGLGNSVRRRGETGSHQVTGSRADPLPKVCVHVCDIWPIHRHFLSFYRFTSSSRSSISILSAGNRLIVMPFHEPVISRRFPLGEQTGVLSLQPYIPMIRDKERQDNKQATKQQNHNISCSDRRISEGTDCFCS